jgi:malonate-semialdehyde dehydrogenase (acetylating)/methylmalonate-semialdehyde dehydrogenase
MFDLVYLIKKNSEDLAKIITEEHGKTLPDARGDVQRGNNKLNQVWK